jgi:uncharacterized repeat protein (TIGR01451 family)
MKNKIIAAVFAGFMAISTTGFAFNVSLQSQNFGNTNWTTGTISGWGELDHIPCRLLLTGAAGANQTINIPFDHTKKDSPIIGVQDLIHFTASANLTIISTTLTSPPGQTPWIYTLVVSKHDSAAGEIRFSAILGAGSHNFTGATLNIGDTPSPGKLAFLKPAAIPGTPDLSVVKSGPATVNPGQLITYAIRFTNAATGSFAEGVQVTDTLPDLVTFVSASEGVDVTGNTITWTLGGLNRGATGLLTYQAIVSPSAGAGQSFTNYSTIASAQNDTNPANNTAFVVTRVTNACIPPTIAAHPESATNCTGSAATLTVIANGTDGLFYQWRKNNLPIADATNATYTIPALLAEDAGSYDVIVSNLCGTVTSATATLAVIQPLTCLIEGPATLCPQVTEQIYTATTSVTNPTYTWAVTGNATISGDTTNATVSVTPTGSFTVSVTIEDAGIQCPTSCSLPVTVADTTAPTITAPSGITVSTDAGSCAATVTLESPVTSDNCAVASLTNDAPATFPKGTTTVTWTVTDASGNTASDTQTVTVNDTENPVITAPANLIVNVDAGQCAATGVNLGTPDAADNCPGFTVSNDAPTTFPVGDTAVTWTVTDTSGNTATASQTVTVVDNIAPTIVCPANITVDAAPGATTYTGINLGTPTTSDNCAVADVANDAPTTFPVGSTTVTWTVIDVHGNTNTCRQTVTVNAVNAAPVANADSFNLAEDDTLTGNVLTNDTDAENSPLTAVKLSDPASGALSLNSDGSFTYIPNDNFQGTDTFTYAANDGDLQSAAATVTIVVAPVDGAGDIDLYARGLGALINRTKSNADKFAIVGRINPRGCATDLTDATVSVKVNGIALSAPITLDATGHGGGAGVKTQLNPNNGRYRVAFTGMDLSEAFDLANVTTNGLAVLDVELTIAGAGLDLATVRGQLETPYNSIQDRGARAKFLYRRNRTLSGAFNSNKTTASESATGHKLTFKGALQAEGGLPVLPTGDIRITIDQQVIALPLTSLTDKLTYSAKLGAVPGLKKFALNNVTHTFQLSTEDLHLTCIPAAGDAAATSCRVPMMIEVPVAGGTNIFETITELKRTTSATKKWSR